MADQKFTIHQYELGPWDNLMYILEDNETKECAIVDPAWDIEVILYEVKKRGVTPTHCLITHNHYDHVNMVEPLLARMPQLPVFMLDIEIDWSNFQCQNLMRVSTGQTIKIGKNTEIKVLHTPGHSPGSMSFHLGNALLTGDAVFINSCGRSDFVGGDTRTLYETITRIRDTMPDETIIYPGHGSLAKGSATIADQKVNNPYFVFKTFEEFEAMRMEGRTPGSPMPDVDPEWARKVEGLQPAQAG